MRLFDLLEYHARELPHVDFVRFGDRRLTYGDASDETNRVAQALVAAGIQPGERVAILTKNCVELLLLYYGATKAGAVPVPLNYRLAPAEWVFLIDDAKAKLVVGRGEYVAALESIRTELPNVSTWIAVDAKAPTGWTAWSDWIAEMPAHLPDVLVDETWDAYQMYTSGTTGRPKGAVITHRAVTAQLHQFVSLPYMHLQPGDPYLIVAPLYHAAAALASFFANAQGCTIVLQEDFVPNEVVRCLDEESIVATTLVPAMIQACLVMVPDVAARRYDSLRFVIYGASPIAEETLRKALEVFDCDFIQGFGMTETTAAVSFLSPADHRRALAEKPALLLSAGRALPGTEVLVVDENDEPLPLGTIGEIVGRGPQLMKGYWNMAEASAEALRGGWMHTGDAGILDADGYLFIQDRVKDMIVSGGENVYPREIENVLFLHPAVADAAVIGIPDERWGEIAHAVIVLRPGHTATVDELVAHCREHLGGFKVPRTAEFIELLPRNPSGKVLKKDLREPYWKGRSRRVS